MAEISMDSTHEAEREVMANMSGYASEPLGYSLTTYAPNMSGYASEPMCYSLTTYAPNMSGYASEPMGYSLTTYAPNMSGYASEPLGYSLTTYAPNMSGYASEPLGYSLTTYAQDHLEEAQMQVAIDDNGNRKKSCSFWTQNKDSQWVGGRDHCPLEPSNISMESEKEVISSVLSQKGSVSICDSKLDTASNQSDDGDDDESVEDLDDDVSDGYDSDSSHESHDLEKKNKWFRRFFETMDNLPVEEVNDLNRRWHCPACHDGPGAIAWYKGLQPLIAHARTKRSLRLKLHRIFAQLIEAELKRRRISIRPLDEASSQLKGLPEPTTLHEIVWPPMVIIVNNLLKKDDNGKWLGIGNQELCEYFSDYAVVKARHSYGPKAYEGMSVLVFEDSAMGYWEAERLHKHFLFSGRDRDAWGQRQMFCPGGEWQLYGYLACKEDMDIFNQDLQGKFCLKFEMRPYQQMVVVPMKKMNEDSHTLIQIKKKVGKLQERIYFLEELLVNSAVQYKMEDKMRALKICKEMDLEADSDDKIAEKEDHIEGKHTKLDPGTDEANSQRGD